MIEEKSIVGVATASLKDVNQDYCICKRFDKIGYTAVAVADGLGSYTNAEKAAGFVCKKLMSILDGYNLGQKFRLEHIFEEINHALREFAEKDSNGDFSALSYGTTLLCCLENQEEIMLGYVGNGGIFHIRGNFEVFPKTQYLPWNSVNLLNPHSIPENGRNALYKLLQPNKTTYEQSIPSIINLNKDEDLFGDIIVVCSDGIYSYDEVSIGKDAQGRIWVSGEESMSIFYNMLSQYVKKEKITNESLSSFLSDFLSELKVKKLVDDDVSIGVLFTNKAIEYLSKKRVNEEEE